MPMYLDTRGRSTIAIAICSRCSCKYPWEELRPDPNSPGLMCCPDGCLDRLDPWRLPQRPADRLALEWARPDVALPVGPQAVAINQMQAVIADIETQDKQLIAAGNAVTQISPSQPWQPSTVYALGNTVTPIATVGFDVGGNIQSVFLCIIPGISGATMPSWTTRAGTTVLDGRVVWFNNGLYVE